VNHLQVWEAEKAWESGDAPWFAYVAACDKALGLRAGSDCDGNEATDGYSLDSCYDAYRVGISAADYAKGARKQPGQRVVRS
jgi:hypothetical protein